MERESGPPCCAFSPKSVRTTPGDTTENWIPGCVACTSARTSAVSAFMKCFAPQ